MVQEKAGLPGKSSAVAEDVDANVGAAPAGPAPGKSTLTSSLADAAPVQMKGDSTKDGAAKPAPADGPKKPSITGVVAAGSPLSDNDVKAIDTAAKTVPASFKHYVAYADLIKVGGSLAWRANNPGNLRSASTQIAKVPGAAGTFAVFATMDDGRAAQRDLYLNKYGSQTVEDAISKLTPPSENDTAAYLAKLQAAGIDIKKTVADQIDKLMPAVEANEGMITGQEVARS